MGKNYLILLSSMSISRLKTGRLILSPKLSLQVIVYLNLIALMIISYKIETKMGKNYLILLK